MYHKVDFNHIKEFMNDVDVLLCSCADAALGMRKSLYWLPGRNMFVVKYSDEDVYLNQKFFNLSTAVSFYNSKGVGPRDEKT